MATFNGDFDRSKIQDLATFRHVKYMLCNPCHLNKLMIFSKVLALRFAILGKNASIFS